MHGLIRRLAIAAGAAALTLGSAAGAAIITATPAQAGSSCTAAGACTYTPPFPLDSGNDNPCYNYTYTVPADITVLHVTVIGAHGFSGETAGSSAYSGGGGGKGEEIETYLAVTPGEQLDVSAGDNGSGGLTGDAVSDNGGNGGDASYISTEVEPSGFSQQKCATGGFLVVAGGGGGGGGGALFGNGGGGGDAGFATGANGGDGDHNGNDAGSGGGGATQTAGGAAGDQYIGGPNTAQSGSFLQGGCADWDNAYCNITTLGMDASDETGGGGGGGYYGGGAAGDGSASGAGGGGGGSSWVDASSVYDPLTNNSLTVSQGTTSADPSVSITPVAAPPGLVTGMSVVGGNQQATVSFSPPDLRRRRACAVLHRVHLQRAGPAGPGNPSAGAGHLQPGHYQEPHTGAVHLLRLGDQPGRRGSYHHGTNRPGGRLSHPEPGGNHQRDGG